MGQRDVGGWGLLLLVVGSVFMLAYIGWAESQPQEPVSGVAEVYTTDPKVVRTPAVCTETVELRMTTGESARCLKGSITAVSIAKKGTNVQRPVIRLTCTCN